MRPVNGLQLLMAQGFPADVRLHFDETCVCDMDLYQAGCLTKFVEGTGKTRVDDMEIRSMAGNTMKAGYGHHPGRGQEMSRSQT
jgi:hypothetical protein